MATRASMSASATTLAELLVELVESNPTLPLYRYLVDGEAECVTLTSGELHQAALSIAEQLRERCKPGDRVLLLAAPGLDFIRGFFGIQYAGLVATSSYPPHPRRVDRTLNRFQAIVSSCEPKVALVTSTMVDFAKQLGLSAIDLNTVPINTRSTEFPVSVKPTAAAILQYTSGSTREPRGVMLTHRNVLNNLAFIKERFGHSRESVGVIWLPLPRHGANRRYPPATLRQLSCGIAQSNAGTSTAHALAECNYSLPRYD